MLSLRAKKTVQHAENKMIQNKGYIYTQTLNMYLCNIKTSFTNT